MIIRVKMDHYDANDGGQIVAGLYSVGTRSGEILPEKAKQLIANPRWAVVVEDDKPKRGRPKKKKDFDSVDDELVVNGASESPYTLHDDFR